MKWAWALVGLGAVVACSSNRATDDDDGGSGGQGGDPIPMPDATIACETTCAAMYPLGEADYGVLRNCTLCESCFNVCTTDFPEICPNGGVEAGCSAVQPTCGACVADPCTGVQQADTTFQGYCAVALGACSANMECVRLNNCVAECVELATTMPMP